MTNSYSYSGITVNVVVATYVPANCMWFDPDCALNHRIVCTPDGWLAEVRSATFWTDVESPFQQVWAVEVDPVLQAEPLFLNLALASVPCDDSAKADCEELIANV